MRLLLDAVRAGATNDAGGALGGSLVGQGHAGMARRVTELLTRTMLATVEEGSLQAVQGGDCFEFACRLVNLQVRQAPLLSVEDNTSLLKTCLTLISGTRPGYHPPRGPVATGFFRLLNLFLTKLPSPLWASLVALPAAAIFDRYLMATDPGGAPQLGWPDDVGAFEARKAGWEALFRIAEVGDEELKSLEWLVDRTLEFVEHMPTPTRNTESGAEEVAVFDPGYNSLRHSRGLVGLKNRRNTCYINSMLQQFFLTPQFCKWLFSIPFVPSLSTQSSQGGGGRTGG
ncbi:hypothetical protein T484DRAFT_1885076, partial [Baffinella frigidus]